MPRSKTPVCQRMTSRSRQTTSTATLTATESAAEAAHLQSERTVAQLRGHIAELETAVLEQQASHEHERAEADAKHAAELEEVNGQCAAAETK